jgi:glucokinase
VGTPGSLEDWIGGATLATRTKNRYADTEALVKASEKGDPDASRIWLAAVKGLAAGIVSLINVLDPEIVILGGGITAAGDSLFAPLASAIEQIEWRPFGPGVAVVPAQLGEHAGAIGAARFAMTFAKEFSSNASL